MKKFFNLALIICLAISLIACGDATKEDHQTQQKSHQAAPAFWGLGRAGLIGGRLLLNGIFSFAVLVVHKNLTSINLQKAG